MAHLRPPHIVPNYGKPKTALPKSNLPHVLLHENCSHQTLLDVKVKQLKTDLDRSCRLLDLHRKSFIVQQSLKQQQLRAMGIYHISYLPDLLAQAHAQMVQSAGGSGENMKKLPLHHRIKTKTNTSNEDNRMLSEDYQTGVIEKDVIMNSDNSRSAGLPSLTRSQSELPRHGVTKSFMTHNIQGLRREKTIAYNGEHDTSLPIRSADDPRFLQLAETLAPLDRPMDGYLRLSPSGRRVMRQFGDYPPWLLPESRRTSQSSNLSFDFRMLMSSQSSKRVNSRRTKRSAGHSSESNCSDDLNERPGSNGSSLRLSRNSSRSSLRARGSASSGLKNTGNVPSPTNQQQQC